MAEGGFILLRLSLGIIYTWFGILKFFAGLSPIEDLAVRTTHILTFNILNDESAIIILATLEVLIGVGLLIGKFLKITLLLLLFQMVGTVAPIFIFPRETFTIIPIAPTLEGQYIIKNLIIISAAIVLGSSIRGGAIVADPEAAEIAQKIEENKLKD
jgi:uncharacterized membrane protein YphA (DoxX/SURF4 family)